MPRSKKYQDSKKLINKDKAYPIVEAIDLMIKTSKTKFDASVEVHLSLGIDTSKGEQQVRGNVNLPHGTGKTIRIAAFVTPKTEKDAKAAGADLIGGKELIDKIKASGKCDFDVAVAEPEIMRDLATIAKTLGPKGLMPSPKSQTITKDIKKIVTDLKGGLVNYKNDDTANIHVVVGKVSFGKDKLKENYSTLLHAIKKSQPQSLKNVYIKNISISSSMGPGIKVEVEN